MCHYYIYRRMKESHCNVYIFSRRHRFIFHAQACIVWVSSFREHLENSFCWLTVARPGVLLIDEVETTPFNHHAWQQLLGSAHTETVSPLSSQCIPPRLGLKTVPRELYLGNVFGLRPLQTVSPTTYLQQRGPSVQSTYHFGDLPIPFFLTDTNSDPWTRVSADTECIPIQHLAF